MALQNSDNFIVSRGGANHRLTWANLLTDIRAGDVLDTAFSVTGDPATALETVVPYSATYGIKLPLSGTNDYETQGSLRYNAVTNKIELYSGTAWGTASGNTAFSSTPPSPASVGDIWYDVDDGRAYVYYDDGDSLQWVEMNPSYNGGVADGTITPVKLSAGAPEWNESGYFGVGTSGTIGAPLHVVGDSTATARFDNVFGQNGSVQINSVFTAGDGDRTGAIAGKITFGGVGHNGASVSPFGEINAVIEDDTIGNEKSSMVFRTISGGVTYKGLELGHNGLVGVGGFSPVDSSALLTIAEQFSGSSYVRPALYVETFEPDIKLIDTDGGVSGGQIKMLDGRMSLRVSTQTDIATDLTERLTILSNGNVGVGEINPTTALWVEGDGSGITVANGSNQNGIRTTASGDFEFYIDSTSTVGLSFDANVVNGASFGSIVSVPNNKGYYAKTTAGANSRILHIGANDITYINANSNTNGVRIQSGGADRVFLESNGDFGIGALPTNKLSVSGAADVSNLYTDTVYLTNLEKANLTVDGQLGFDSSQGLLVYRQQQGTSGATTTVLDGWNVAAGSGISITNLGAGDTGTGEFTFSVDQGTGSGLDADTVDGIEASAFIRTDGSSTYTGTSFGFGNDSAILFFNDGTNVTRTDYWSNKDSFEIRGDGNSKANVVLQTGNLEVDTAAYIGGRLGVQSGGVIFDPLEVSFVDNYKITLGAGDDLAIRSNGTHTYFNARSGADIFFTEADVTRFTFNMGTGELTATGDVTAFSDSRLKEEVEVIDGALDKVAAIRGVTFVRNDLEDETRKTGVIAQEVEAVLPEAVKTDEETGLKTVAYGNMVGLLIEAVKELKADNEQLKAEIETLKGGN